MNESRTLTDFVVATTLSDIPGPVSHHVKRLVLDQLGCQISGATLPWSLVIRKTILALAGPGTARVVVSGEGLQPDEAAFLNSAFGHGNEIDDAHLAVRTHPGAVVVPAAVAMAQDRGIRDGSLLLLAIAMGYEVMLRVAAAAMPDLMEHRHHHTPPAVGPFGAAMAAGRLLELDSEQMQHALAIAGSHSAGLMEYTQSGGSVKRIHTAIPAQAGVRSALLASNGLTGPTRVLEGERGFLKAFSATTGTFRLTEALGQRYLAGEVSMKTYFANYRIHAPLHGLLDLMRRHQIRFADLDRVSVGVSSATVRSVGAISDPVDALGAQFSLQFALALAAKCGPLALREAHAYLDDQDVKTLARRVDVVVGPEWESRIWTSLGADVSIRTRNGGLYSQRVDGPPGSPEAPLGDSDVEDKFRSLAEPVLGRGRTDAIAAAVWSLETTDLARDLWSHLSGGFAN